MIKFNCEGCGKPFSVKDEFAGKKTNCTQCGVALRVPPPKTPAPNSTPTVPPPLPATAQSVVPNLTSVELDRSITTPETTVANSSGRKWLILGFLAAAPVLLIVLGIAAFIAFSKAGLSDEVIERSIRDYFDNIYPAGQELASPLLASLAPRKLIFLQMATVPDGMSLTGNISRVRTDAAGIHGQPIQAAITEVHLLQRAKLDPETSWVYPERYLLRLRIKGTIVAEYGKAQQQGTGFIRFHKFEEVQQSPLPFEGEIDANLVYLPPKKSGFDSVPGAWVVTSVDPVTAAQ